MMSRTRSRAQNENENATRVTGKRPQIDDSKPKLGQVKGRAALGDITNNLQDKMPEKKPSTKPFKEYAPPELISSTVLPPPVPVENVEETRPVPVAVDPVPEGKEEPSDEAEMEPVDEHTNESVHLGEMKLAEAPPLSLVDVGDVNNAQAVVEYVAEIMAHFRRSEGIFAPSREYMSKQTDISPKMREILIDWLIEVHLKFKLRPETLYLTVSNIDRFLERHAVSRTKLQLVGCTAMLLAAKYEEIYAPEVRDFVYISDKAYTREQILQMEAIMLRTLEFKLTVPTAFRFGERFIKVALSGTDPQLHETRTHLANFLMELTLQEYSFLKYMPSMVAASAIYLAMKMTGQTKPWSELLESETQYSERLLQECITELYTLAARGDSSKYRAVRKKYLSRKFGEVSKTQFPMPQ